ncbi:MAG: hypothetical protein M1837_001129 [Sclerophora amabilis]|nr:MAG: hypothetical protein M1837_001129 [Sclerophora amabilis]
MSYLVPIHRPSSIRWAVTLNFLTPDEECLVVAKANRLEFWRQDAGELVLEHHQVVFGRVTMLHRLRSVSHQPDHLFVGTNRHAYFTVSWDQATKRLKTEKSYMDQAEGGAREVQNEEKCVVDPSGRYFVLESFEGIITVIPILKSKRGSGKPEDRTDIGPPVPARIPELFVRSLAFLYGYHKPRLALLWEDGHGKAYIKVKEISYTAGNPPDPGVVEINDTTITLANLRDQGASHIIPVEEHQLSFIVLGETTIIGITHDGSQLCTLRLTEPTVFVAWERLSRDRFVLADDYGNLHLLWLTIISDDEDFSGRDAENLDIKKLGSTSRASSLVSLGNGFMFVASHQGDSKVVKIDEKKGSVQDVQSMSNIAPVLDFAVMDMGSGGEEGQTNEYSSGQARIVTGSGAFQDGSLRSVRSGVGLEELGILGNIGGIRDMFSLRSTGAQRYVDTLVASFVGETRVFRFGSEGEVEEVGDYKGFDLSESTMVAANVLNEQILQVTASSVRLVDTEGGTILSEWTPAKGQTITDSAANDDKVLIAVDGVSLLVLDIQAGLAILAEKHFDNQSQIACLAVPGPTSSICIAGFWQSATISIFGLKSLDLLHTETVGDESGVSVPRTILMTQVLAEEPPTLFVGMADGIVFTFSVSLDYSLFAKKRVVLGTQQASFRTLSRPDGLHNVFAICEHPSLIYGSEGKLIYSAVTADTATCVCPFDSELYPGSIMVATAEELKIAAVDTKRATHVRSLPVKETVRRVAYSARLRAFGLGTIARSVQDGREIAKGHVKLVDEVLFGLLDTYDLDTDEVVESSMRAELDDGNGEARERFIVGTGYLDEENDEALRGRILIFDVTEDRKLFLIAEKEVKGACKCLDVLDNCILAGLVKSVVVYSFRREASRSKLRRRASYRTSTAPVDFSVTGNHVAISDLMKSVSIAEFKRGENGLSDSLTEVARHFQTTWSTGVAHVAEDTYLESDAEGNLMVLHQNQNGVTEDDRRRLEVTSEMLLDEVVNKIQRITVPASPDATVIPRAFLATVDGSIYLFALIAPRKQGMLMSLQASMAAHVRSIGHLPFNKYRAFKNTVRQADEPFRFVDGELIERFLECEESLQEEIVDGVKASAEEVRAMVESLKRLH